jgi:hypothetical protein
LAVTRRKVWSNGSIFQIKTEGLPNKYLKHRYLRKQEINDKRNLEIKFEKIARILNSHGSFLLFSDVNPLEYKNQSGLETLVVYTLNL